MTKLWSAAFFENQDGAGTIQRMAALPDNTVTWVQVSGDEMKVPQGATCILAVYGGLDPTVEGRIRLEAGSFKETYGRTYVEVPFINATVEPGSNAQWNDFRPYPIKVRSGESLYAESLNNPSSATDQFIVIVFGDGKPSPVDPDGGFWIRTAATAAAVTANGWTTVTLALSDFTEQLGNDVLDVYGAKVVSTSVIAARLGFHGQDWEPPIGVVDDVEDIVAAPFATPGTWGKLGELTAESLPKLKLLCDAADNEAQPLWLYVKRRKGSR